MAYIADVEVGDAEVTALQTKEDAQSFVKTVIWAAYDKNKHRKLGLGIIGKIVRLQYVSDLRWFIVLLVGEL